MAIKIVTPQGQASTPPVRQGGSGLPGLPEEPRKVDNDILRYSWLIYGREKIGKTVLLSSFPDILFLATEPGTRGLPVMEYNAEDGGCKSWEHFLKAVELLERTNRFRVVAVDTGDRAYDMCLDYVCRNLGIEYPGETVKGREDYGKSWGRVRKEFVDTVHRISRTGRGVVFTSHVNEIAYERPGGIKGVRIIPSLGKQAREAINAVVDIIAYAEYVRVKGAIARVMFFHGDDVVWAGFRCPAHFPPILPLEKENGYEVLRKGFLGEHPGISPLDVISTWQVPEGSIRVGTPDTDTLISRLKAEEVKAHG